MTRKDPVAVVGVHVTKLARQIEGRSSFDLTLEAVKGALFDAGIQKDEVDGACLAWGSPSGAERDGSSNWARILGVTLRWTINDGIDAVGVRGLLNAGAAIQAGLCETVVIGGAVGGNRWAGPVAVGAAMPLEFAQCWGSSVMAQFALVARRHMYEFGTTEEQTATVSASIRNHGSVNPEAAMFGQGPYSVRDVLNSRMIADPLRLLDCCMICQGGSAMVITTGERARQLRKDPVYLLGGGLEIFQTAYAYPPLYRDVGMIGQATANRLYHDLGIRPSDLDVLSLYDPTSFEIIRQMECLGFCDQGEGGPFVEGGTLDLLGKHPTNLDGGLLSHAWLGREQLTLKVIEVVRQLRGTCGPRQVPGAKLGLASNAGAGASHYEIAILGRG